MIRIFPMFPMAWTALQLALASAAAWFLYESDTLGDAAAMLFVR